MSRCRSCGKDLMQYRCDDCDAQFAKDIAEKRYPAAFIEAGIVPSFDEWQDVREFGRKAANVPGATSESVRAETERIGRACVEARRRKALEAAKTPAQRRAEEEEKLKKAIHTNAMQEFYAQFSVQRFAVKLRLESGFS